ncbi:PAS domain S-box protein [Tautonia plasticadhaerens]|uniref:histidine kinase n=1 Tax=Tautonia plasticadhaerens TaxID=2527974 RepID=A0A518H3M6_9BACT|nr:PAS domain S-box protein [Tautonia plasticadhaerens]QDV35456.1 Autoinducer 2 sensor kinase/phosphatase LuxQ [Tautonia plasticadhaerens]
MLRNRRHPALDYLIAALAVGLAALLRLALSKELGPRQPYATFYLSVLFAALYLGQGPGILAASLGLAAGMVLFVVPHEDMFVADPGDLVVLTTYLFVSVSTLVLCGSYRRMLRRIEEEAGRRCRAEEAERGQRERLEATLASLGEAVLVTGADGKVLTLNPAAERLTGWAAADATGRPISDVFHTRDRETTRTEELPVAEILGGGLVHRTAGPALLRRRDGSELPVEASSAAIRGGGERDGGLVVVARDVSDRLAGEEAERVDRERLRLAMEAGRLGAWDCDLRTGLVRWSEHDEARFGLPPGSFGSTLDGFRALIVAEDRAPFEAALARATAEGRPFEVEFRIRRRDGSILWMSLRGAVLRDDEGRAVRLLGICADVTDRMRSEQTSLFLADAGAALSTLVDEGETLGRLARLAVPFFADWAAVDLAGPDGLPRRVSVAHVDPEKVALAHELSRRDPPGPDTPHGACHVLRSGRSELVEEISAAMIDGEARDDEHRRMLLALGLRSTMCVPLRTRDRVLGAITFATAESGRRFGPADLAIAEDLAHRATIALQNSRLYAELRQSERRFRQLAEHITAVFYVSDTGSPKMHYISPAYEAVWGRSCRSLYDDPMSFLEAVDPEDRGRVAGAIGRQVLGEPTAEEYRIRRPDGEIRWIYDRAFPVRDESGRVFRVAGIAEDVTDRKRAEAELRAGEERFRLLAEAVPQFVWIIRADGRLEYVNRRWLEYTGLTEDGSRELVSRQGVFHPDDRQAVLDRWAEAERSGGDFEAEYRIRGKTGEYRWFLGRAVPARRLGDRVESWFGTATDIDDRKRAERTLRLLADSGILLADPTDFRGTLERVPRLVVPALADSCVVYLVGPGGAIDRAAIAHRDEACRALMVELLEGSAIDPSGPSPVAEVIRTGRPDLRPELDEATLEALIPDPDRRDRFRPARPTSHLIVPMVVGGRTVGAFGLAATDSGRRFGPDDLPVAEDLARRAAIALENARLYQELREADRRKTEFLAVLAHELRNPLAPIRTALHLMKRRGEGPGADAPPDPDEFEQVRSMADRQVAHMARLIEDLMDVTRITRGTIELRPEAVELVPVARRVLAAIAPQAREAEQELSWSLPARPVRLRADPARVEQILWNLLSNAVKYSDRGGRISLSAEVDDGGSSATIRVRDTGIGIAPDQLGHIFGLFVQVDRGPGRHRGGLGIGLNLVRTLVELHGGSISARSAGPGLGSEFVVSLPILTGPEAEGSSAPAPAPGPGPEAGRAGPPARRRILVVDDNRDAAVSLGKVLGKLAGHDVRIAHDGPEAIALAAGFTPEVVLLDIGLPGMDGFEVARRLRQSPEGAAATLIALTGWGQQEDRRRSREAGFDHHLVKPVDTDEVEGLIASIPPPPTPDSLMPTPGRAEDNPG